MLKREEALLANKATKNNCVCSSVIIVPKKSQIVSLCKKMECHARTNDSHRVIVSAKIAKLHISPISVYQRDIRRHFLVKMMTAYVVQRMILCGSEELDEMLTWKKGCAQDGSS